MSISIWSNTRRVWLAAGVLSTAALVAVWSANARAAQPPAAGASAPAACPHEQHMGGMMGGMMGREAKGAGMPMMPMAGRGMERMFKQLDLSAQQKDQIQKVQAAAHTQMDQLREEGSSLHEQGRTLWSAATLDEPAIEQWRQKLSAHHDKMSQHMTRTMLDVAKVLTPAQRAKAVELMQSHRGHHMKHGGRSDHSH